MSNNYFGTDGIRAKFNEGLTIRLALEVGIAAGLVFGENAKVCIGLDPRESSKAIENALAAGIVSTGVDVRLVGVVTTPVISYEVANQGYDCGIMISASHNPYYDNGIKFFGPDGKKLSDELESRIEQEIAKQSNFVASRIGNITYDKHATRRYIDYIKEQGVDFTNKKVGLDCANGSSSLIAPIIFKELGAMIEVIGNEPNGININDQVGSTHPEQLAKLVVEKNLDFGFSFDGDGDRIILVNGEGDILDGDYIIYLITRQLKEENKLKNNISVGTVMANLGFKKALKELSVDFVETKVGDRFVMQAITEENAAIGGEQSGHIILPDILPTGDGILTGVYLAKIFTTDMAKLTNLKKDLEKFPQVLVNLVVDSKEAVLNDEELNKIIEQQSNELGDEGRILVRASGTEQLIRVMSEAPTEEVCNSIIEPIIHKIKNI